MQLAVRVCGPESVEVAAYARCLAQMSEDYSQFLSPGLPRPFYMPNPVPLYRQTLAIIEKVMGPEDQSVSRVLLLRFRILLVASLTEPAPGLLDYRCTSSCFSVEVLRHSRSADAPLQPNVVVTIAPPLCCGPILRVFRWRPH